MDTRTQILAIIGALVLGLVHALDKNTPAFPFMTDGLRALLASACGIITGVVDSMVNGTQTLPAIVTVFAVSGPAFVVLAVTALANAISGKPGGTATIDLSKDAKSLPPPNPPPYSVKLAEMPGVLVALSVLLVLGAIGYGCAAAQTGCLVVKAVDAACTVFEVPLKDGTKERVPLEKIQRLGEQQKAERLAIEKVERQGK